MISRFDDEYFNDPEIKSYLDDCENIEERKSAFRDTIQYNLYILHREFQELFKILKESIMRRNKWLSEI